MTRDERKIITKRQFIYYLRCLSLRKTAKYFHCDNEVLSYRFRTYLHPHYTQLSRKGVCGEMRRYLLSTKHSEAKKQEIEQWIIANIENILELDFNNGVNFHTETTANKLSRKDFCYIDDYALPTWRT